MRLSLVLALVSISLHVAEGFVTPQGMVPQAPRSLTRVNGDKSGVEVLTDFNTSFKKGLKFVLVPNAKENTISSPSASPGGVSTGSSSLMEESASVVGWNDDASAAIPDPVPIVTSPTVPDPVAAGSQQFRATKPPFEMPKFDTPKLEMPSFKAPEFDASNFAIPKPMLSVPEREPSEYVQSAVNALRENYQSNMARIIDSPRAPGSAPSLYDYLKDKDWESLKFQTFSMDGYPFVPLDKIQASIDNVKELAQSGTRWTIPDLATAAKWDEIGGWYFVSLSLFCLMILSLTADVSEDDTAVASVASPAVKTEAPSFSMADQDKMQSQVDKLTEATSAVMVELNQLKAEKATRDYDLATMKSDVRMLELRIEASERSEAALKGQLEKAEQTIKAQATQVSELEAEKKALKKQLDQAIAEAEGAMLEAVPAVAPEPKEAEPKKSAEKSTPVPAPAPSPVPVEIAAADLPFFSSVEETTDGLLPEMEVAKNGATKAKKATKKTAKKAAKKTAKKSTTKADVEVVELEDWSTLSLSTLKRKTVKDLANYLETKGETATDADGKPLKKAELVETVLSLK